MPDKDGERGLLELIGRLKQAATRKKKPSPDQFQKEAAERTGELSSNLGRSMRDLKEWKRKGPRRRTGPDALYYD